MAELDFKIIDKKQNPRGHELWLIERPDGSRSVMMPRTGGKDKVRLELLQQLRTIIPTSGDLSVEGLVKLQGVKAFEESILLDFGNPEGLWENWEAGMPERVTPNQAADLLRTLTAAICKLQEQGINELLFHSSDAINRGNFGIGFIDPRIGAVFENVDPVRPHRELCLPPEVIQSQPWSTKGMLYTAGLMVYTLLCGTFPFGMESLSESASAVLIELPLDPRCYAPETSERLATIIHALLEKKPEQRPGLDETIRALKDLSDQNILSSPSEQEVFKTKSAAQFAKREKVRQVRRIWQVGRWAALGVIIVAAVLFFAKPGYKAKLTPNTPPQKVVDQFYSSYAKLDVMSLDETLYKTGKDIDRMVSSAFVLSSYNPEQKARKVLVLGNLRVNLEGNKPTEKRYMAQYQLELYNSGGRNIQQRRDRLTLRHVKGIWKIVNYQSKIISDRFIKDPHASKRLDKVIRKR
jgi:serine/threonine protein kinase